MRNGIHIARRKTFIHYIGEENKNYGSHVLQRVSSLFGFYFIVLFYIVLL
jgi:hypothetical protein